MHLVFFTNICCSTCVQPAILYFKLYLMPYVISNSYNTYGNGNKAAHTSFYQVTETHNLLAAHITFGTEQDYPCKFFFLNS
jgi:hypothetical protein